MHVHGRRRGRVNELVELHLFIVMSPKAECLDISKTLTYAL